MLTDKIRLLKWVVTICLITVAILALAIISSRPLIPASANNATSSLPKKSSQLNSNLVESFLNLPLSFEPNNGQVDSQVKFISRGSGYTLFLTENESVLSLRRLIKGEETKNSSIRFQLVGANTATQVTGKDQLIGRSNYLVGNNRANWRLGVARFGKVDYREVYPGIDLSYYGNQRQLEYDFIVSPKGDPTNIIVEFGNVSSLDITRDGDLELTTALGKVYQKKPIIYQDINGKRSFINGSYRLITNNSIGFNIGTYNKSFPLVIDPILTYGTYLGGSAGDFGNGIALDAAGNYYLVGTTFSPDFPTLNTPQPNQIGGNDIFVSKINAAGTQLIYSTYFGGSADDNGADIAVDSNNNIYVTGSTNSPDFPLANPFQAVNNGGSDAFIAQINSVGNGLNYSTYYGGSSNDRAKKLALDSSNNIYIVGETSSNNLSVNLSQGTGNSGLIDAFILKLDSNGQRVLSRYLGGSDNDIAEDIDVDSNGNIYLTGGTISTNFPVANVNSTFLRGGEDIFVTKLTSVGLLSISRYIGGLNTDHANSIKVDSSGNIYLAGRTNSTSFPANNPVQDTNAGLFDGFVIKLTSAAAIQFSSYLGGNGDDEVNSLAVDNGGNIYVTGTTDSINFPTLNALQNSNGGGQDAFLVKIDPINSLINYATYLGGTNNDQGNALIVDINGTVYLTGSTSSSDLPTVNPGQISNNGGNDLFLMVIKDCAITITPASLPPGSVGAPYNQTISSTNGLAPLTFTVTGNLPPGLSLNSSTGNLTGTPTLAGNFNFRVTVADANGCSINQNYTITISQGGCSAITFTPSQLPSSAIGSDYNFTITAAGGNPPYNFAIANGQLPDGLTLSSNGAISGTAAATGLFNFTVGVTDSDDCTGSQAYTITVTQTGCSFTILPDQLPGAVLGALYNQELSPFGGSAPFTFELTNGALPAGLTLNSSGTISGTPTQLSNNSFTIKVTDATNCAVFQQYTLSVCPAIQINPTSLNNGLLNTAYNATTLTASGGQAPYSFTVSSGNLPTGLTLSSSGLLSGTPTASATYNFTISALDANGCSGARNYTLAISTTDQCAGSDFNLSSLTTANAPFGVTTSDFNRDGKQDLVVANYNANTLSIFIAAATGGFNAPTSIATGLNPSAVVSGDFNSDGKFDLAVTNAGSNNLSIFLGNGTGGFAAPTNFEVGVMPIGLAVGDFNKDNLLDLVTANYNNNAVILLLGDGKGSFNFDRQYFVCCNPIAVTFGDFNSDGNMDFASANYLTSTVSIFYGNGVDGITDIGFFNVGTNPTAIAAGDFDKDGQLDLVTANYNSNNLTLLSGSINNFNNAKTIVAGSAPRAIITADFNGDNQLDLAIANQSSNSIRLLLGTGDGNFISSGNYTVGSGPVALTNGIFNGDGRVDLAAVNFSSNSVTVMLNSCGQSGCPAITLTPAILANGTIDLNYSQAITASGGQSPYTFSVLAGQLPAGLSLTSTGTLTGKPAAAGLFSFLIRARAANGCTGALPYTLFVPLPATATITSFTPTSGIVGTSVTLTGNNFATVTDVLFNGVNAGTFTFTAPSTIKVNVPAGSTTGPILLLNKAGQSTSTTVFKVTPKITSVTPNNGIVGDTITINGTTLGNPTSVKFGTIFAQILDASDSQIHVVVPTGAITSTITVTTPDGSTTSPSMFTVVLPPTISTISPASGPVGTVVTVSGTNLSAVTDVKFNGLSANPATIVTTATTVKAAVPPGATTGLITVTNRAGSKTSTTVFKVTPKITSVTPNNGIVGDTITINGTTLSNPTSVKFGTIAASVVSSSDSQIVTTVPVNAVTASITVVTAGGTATSPTTFTVVLPPTISTITPATGPIGTVVTINGTNLGAITDVKFNGVSANPATIVPTAASVKATVPPGATTGLITVTNRAGSKTSTTVFKVTPKITSVTPNNGVVGDTITINGTSLATATSIKFGTIIAPIVTASSTQLTTTVPAGAVTSSITVTTPDGSAVSPTTFTVVLPPTISTISPASGPVGTVVTVSGTNLSAVTDVKFNGLSANPATIVTTATTVKAAVPPGATTGLITVTNRAGSKTSTAVFKVTPKITAVTPNNGLAGDTITITGTNLANVTAVKFGTLVATIVSSSSTQIVTVVPNGAVTALITVTTPDGIATSPTTFTIILPPTISTFSPTSGRVGTIVTISGTNLGALTDVKFNGVSVTGITTVSATQVKVAVPTGATTGLITVINRAGTKNSTANFTVLP